MAEKPLELLKTPTPNQLPKGKYYGVGFGLELQECLGLA